MFTYYLCDDNKTIYRLELSIKREKMEYYLSLLENYLTELVFIEENETKKLVKKEKIKQENKESINFENGQLLLEKQEVLNIEEIEDYLPSIITIISKKYSFLRSYTIFMLIKLLSDDITRSNNTYIKKILNLFDKSRCWYVDFSSIYGFFFNKTEEFLEDKYYDYNSLEDLLGSLDVNITAKYSVNELLSFWAGDEADREIADGIVNDATTNKNFLRRFKTDFFPFDGQQLIMKRR